MYNMRHFKKLKYVITHSTLHTVCVEIGISQWGSSELEKAVL